MRENGAENQAGERVQSKSSRRGADVGRGKSQGAGMWLAQENFLNQND
jgi:hypothetical protein